ncbi:hypothetical protein TWF281_004521 [Arthrobotrys megalospora]
MSLLPLEIQFLIIEVAEWMQWPKLAQVCPTWRRFINQNIHSPQFLAGRYTYHPDGTSNPLYFHRILTDITHYLYVGNTFRPCYIEFHDDGDDDDEQSSAMRGNPQIDKFDCRRFFNDPVVVPYHAPDAAATPVPVSALSNCSPINLNAWTPPSPPNDDRMIEQFTFSLEESRGNGIGPINGARVISLLLVRLLKSLIGWGKPEDGRGRGLLKVDVMYRISGGRRTLKFRVMWLDDEVFGRVRRVVRILH